MALVVGDEWADGEVTARDLVTGEEARVANDAGSISEHVNREGA